MRKTKRFSAGDLVRIVRADGWSLCKSQTSKLSLREMPLHQPKFGLTEDECLSLEGRLALVTEVVLNKLGQPTVYKLEVSGRQMLCKSKLAEKYFEKVKK